MNTVAPVKSKHEKNQGKNQCFLFFLHSAGPFGAALLKNSNKTFDFSFKANAVAPALFTFFKILAHYDQLPKIRGQNFMTDHVAAFGD